jgi:ElaB/YqjD/DUF883 family membrane-anchored ribosome-binding protein
MKAADFAMKASGARICNTLQMMVGEDLPKTSGRRHVVCLKTNSKGGQSLLRSTGDARANPHRQIPKLKSRARSVTCFKTAFSRSKDMPDMKDKLRGGIESAADMANEWTHEAGHQARAAAKKLDEPKAGGMVEAVKEGVQDAAAGASELAGKVTETAKEWASSVGDAAVHAKDKAQEAVSAAAEKAGDVGQELTTFIRRYPMQSLLVGFAAGFLTAQLVRRS